MKRNIITSNWWNESMAGGLSSRFDSLNLPLQGRYFSSCCWFRNIEIYGGSTHRGDRWYVCCCCWTWKVASERKELREKEDRGWTSSFLLYSSSSSLDFFSNSFSRRIGLKEDAYVRGDRIHSGFHKKEERFVCLFDHTHCLSYFPKKFRPLLPKKEDNHLG